MTEVTRSFCWHQNFYPWGLYAPLPWGYIHALNHEKMYKIRIQRDFFKTCNKWRNVLLWTIQDYYIKERNVHVFKFPGFKRPGPGAKCPGIRASGSERSMCEISWFEMSRTPNNWMTVFVYLFFILCVDIRNINSKRRKYFLLHFALMINAKCNFLHFALECNTFLVYIFYISRCTLSDLVKSYQTYFNSATYMYTVKASF